MKIKYEFTTLNQYINIERGNRYKAAKIKKDTTYALALMMRNKPKFKTPCGIKFTHYLKNRRTDPDNISAMVHKFCLDAMQKANIIENDSIKYITHFEDRFIVCGYTGVKIERLEPVCVDG